MAEFRYRSGDRTVTLDIEQVGGHLRAEIDGRSYLLQAHYDARGQLDLTGEGWRQRFYVAHSGRQILVGSEGQTWRLEKPDVRSQQRGAGAFGASGRLTAAMPGLILDVLVAEGDSVVKGETIVLMEAMKMELRITAPLAGVVMRIGCRSGEVAERGQLLVELAAEG